MRVFLSVLLVAPMAAVAVPVQLTQQGRMLDSLGDPIDGSFTLVVRLYDSPNGTKVFEQSFAEELESGYYSVLLDTNAVTSLPLDSSLFADPSLYVTVGSATEELAGPMPLASVPFAVEATVTRSIPVSSATGSCDDGEIRWNPNIDVLQVCDGAAWTTASGSAGLTQGTYSNATVTVNAQGQITSVSTGSAGPSTVVSEVKTRTTLASWTTTSCSTGYTLSGCACRYVSDSTNFWPGWCEAVNTSSCRGRGYYGGTWTYQVQAICTKVQ